MRGPPSSLLRPQPVVPRGLDSTLERAGEVAAVVHGPHWCLVRLVEASDEVAAPNLDRVHPDLRGEEVDGPFESRARLGATGPPVGEGRWGVGGDGSEC